MKSLRMVLPETQEMLEAAMSRGPVALHSITMRWWLRELPGNAGVINKIFVY